MCAGITEDGDDSPAAIEHAYRWILLRGGVLSVVLFILWPLLTLPARVFSKGYWTFWVALSMAWGASPPGHSLQANPVTLLQATLSVCSACSWRSSFCGRLGQQCVG